MPKTSKKITKSNPYINVEKEFKLLGTKVQDQFHSMSLDQEPVQIKQLIVDFVSKYGEFKTILSLSDLWTPSVTSRSKGTPRPQNSFMLYRKNVSKGLYIMNKPMSVIHSSKMASYLWNKLESKDFWYQLAKIAKAIHLKFYPNYKYNPVKNNKKSSSISETQNNVTEDNIINSNSKISTINVTEDIFTNSDSNKEELNEKINSTKREVTEESDELNLDHFTYDSYFDLNLYNYNYLDPILYDE